MVTKLGTISVFFLLFFIPTAAFAGHEPIIGQLACNLIWYPPYYDCREVLVILVFDQRYPPYYNSDTDTFFQQSTDEDRDLANAYFNVPNPTNSSWINIGNKTKFNMIILGDTYKDTGVSRFDAPHHTPVWHEIKHIMCLCGWHPSNGGD